MSKLKLDPESLTVVTFDAADGGEQGARSETDPFTTYATTAVYECAADCATIGSCVC